MLSLAEAIDTHVHTSPDVVPRAQNDLELVQSALGAEMRGVVLKNHYFPTADRARLARMCFPQVAVLGGIVLNAAASGGLNPDAVKASIKVGGRVVWLPTTSASNHRHYATQHPEPSSVAVSPVVDVMRNGAPVPELDSILELIAADDLVLATGHVASDEVVAIVRRAQERGVHRIVVTHPELPIVNMPVDTQRDLASKGVFFERCYFSVLAGTKATQIVDQIRAVGVASTVLATDLGQVNNPAPVDGFRMYGELLIRGGIREAEWWTMTRANPARMLGLD